MSNLFYIYSNNFSVSTGVLLILYCSRLRTWDFTSARFARICRPSPARSAGSDRLIAKCITGAFCGHSPPFRVLVPCLGTKKLRTRHKTSFLIFWRRAWDSNPRGFNTLLAFQASSLATRSTLPTSSPNLQSKLSANLCKEITNLRFVDFYC